MLKLITGSTLLTLSLLSPLAQAADAPAAAGHYLTLYAVPGVPLDDDPYTWSTAGGKQLTKGVTKADGRAYLKGDAGVETYILETLSMRRTFAVPARCWQETPAAFQSCLKLKHSTSQYDLKQDAETLAREKNQQAKAAAYVLAARANDDALAWLGKLPPQWSMQEHARRLLSIGEKLQRHIADGLRQGGPDARQFVCKAPTAYDALPQQQAVLAYQLQPPPELHAGAVWEQLLAAAAQGNWMARLEVYYALAERKVSELSYVEQVRLVQLMEWLHQREIAGLYSFFSARTIGDGATQERVERLAAMQGSVMDQSAVGTLLQDEDDPALVAAGKRMLDCAAKAMQAPR
ncbi:hypothetical protein CSZ94_04300 [Janthinobacterium sp. ROICE36]|uniref:hypothetical protein n=1 Tax=Janthinobacterium sp. ROICE36 TaxID=2048670 RepID=UPI000C7ECF24|nr:hypothetical protein [Janthinobacterium sp. ROICE36]PLY45819.1 hypothetical protein CSZ94_04300 [Janthinobacterium sp. ROICE36]